MSMCYMYVMKITVRTSKEHFWMSIYCIYDIEIIVMSLGLDFFRSMLFYVLCPARKIIYMTRI